MRFPKVKSLNSMPNSSSESHRLFYYGSPRRILSNASIDMSLRPSFNSMKLFPSKICYPNSRSWQQPIYAIN